MGKVSSYIQNMHQQFGPEWIVAQRPEDIQRNAKRIIKDMAKGSINYEQYAYCFADPKFMDNLIIAINNELEINTLNLNACKFYFQYYPQTPNLSGHIYHMERQCYAYSIVLERLNSVKMTGNIGYLADIAGLLFNDRNHLN
jgi:hypothetical protein